MIIRLVRLETSNCNVKSALQTRRVEKKLLGISVRSGLMKDAIECCYDLESPPTFVEMQT